MIYCCDFVHVRSHAWSNWFIWFVASKIIGRKIDTVHCQQSLYIWYHESLLFIYIICFKRAKTRQFNLLLNLNNLNNVYKLIFVNKITYIGVIKYSINKLLFLLFSKPTTIQNKSNGLSLSNGFKYSSIRKITNLKQHPPIWYMMDDPSIGHRIAPLRSISISSSSSRKTNNDTRLTR